MTQAKPYDRPTALAAAMSLFWEKGYHATSLKDLEAALHMKPGSIYAAFANKQNLYLAALEHYLELNRGGFQAEMARASSPLSGLIAQIRAYGTLPPDHDFAQACMLIKTLIDTRSTDPAIAARTRDYLAIVREEFAGAFAQAKAAGELAEDADVERLARRLQACVNALRMELHQGTPQGEIVALAEDFAHEFERMRLHPH
jgi:TetR/AcrR family transcriptional repressor of nem operon